MTPFQSLREYEHFIYRLHLTISTSRLTSNTTVFPLLV